MQPKMTINKITFQRLGAFMPAVKQQCRFDIRPENLTHVLALIPEYVYGEENGIEDRAYDQIHRLASAMVTTEAVGGAVLLEGGGGTERSLFEIEVELGESFLGKERILINGYTDRLASDASGRLDPETVFYINTIENQRSVRTHPTSPCGQQEEWMTTSTKHCVTAGKDEMLYPLSVNDIAIGLEGLDLISALNIQGLCVCDTRVSFKEDVRYRESLELDPAWIVTGFVRSVKNLMSLEDYFDDNNFLLRLTQHTYFQSEDPFLNALRYNTWSNPETRRLSTFTCADLFGIDPDFRSGVTTVLNYDPVPEITYVPWTDTRNETKVAERIFRQLSAFARQYGIRELTIGKYYHPEETFGLDEFSFRGDLAYITSEAHEFLACKRNQLRQLIADATEGMLATSVIQNIHIDTTRCSTLAIQLWGGEEVHYNYPSFYDAAFSSITTASKEHYDEVIEQFNTVFEAVRDHVHSK